MLKTKEELRDRIINLVKKNIGNRNLINQQVEVIKNSYNIPTSISFDILTLKTDPIDETENILFAILDVLSHNDVSKYFSEKEISAWSKWNYKDKKAKFPLKFKMVKISETQWIGKITVSELMKLRDSQLVNYNENTQRRLKRIISGNEEWYQIDVNRVAVNAIINSYENGEYIPNTITLNMQEDDKLLDYEYDEELGELLINNLTAFDIIDGYHRYLAMSNIYNLNKKFDYTMELRIVNFSEDTAKQFIWQEDQKTKMHKIDSDALNQFSYANNVVERLNIKDLKGKISRNNGIIDFTTVTQLVGSIWFSNKKTKASLSKIIELRDYLYNKFEVLLQSDSTILDKKWNYKFTGCAIVLFSYDTIPDESLLSEINALYQKSLKEENKEVFSGRTFNRTCINRIKKLYEGRM